MDLSDLRSWHIIRSFVSEKKVLARGLVVPLDMNYWHKSSHIYLGMLQVQSWLGRGTKCFDAWPCISMIFHFVTLTTEQESAKLVVRSLLHLDEPKKSTSPRPQLVDTALY